MDKNKEDPVKKLRGRKDGRVSKGGIKKREKKWGQKEWKEVKGTSRERGEVNKKEAMKRIKKIEERQEVSKAS